MAQDGNTPPFSFDLELPHGGADPKLTLEKFVREQLRGLLDIVVLTSNGTPVDVDGFQWSRDAFCRTTEIRKESVPIFYPPNAEPAADDK